MHSDGDIVPEKPQSVSHSTRYELLGADIRWCRQVILKGGCKGKRAA